MPGQTPSSIGRLRPRWQRSPALPALTSVAGLEGLTGLDAPTIAAVRGARRRGRARRAGARRYARPRRPAADHRGEALDGVRFSSLPRRSLCGLERLDGLNRPQDDAAHARLERVARGPGGAKSGEVQGRHDRQTTSCRGWGPGMRVRLTRENGRQQGNCRGVESGHETGDLGVATAPGHQEASWRPVQSNISSATCRGSRLNPRCGGRPGAAVPFSARASWTSMRC